MDGPNLTRTTGKDEYLIKNTLLDNELPVCYGYKLSTNGLLTGKLNL